MVRRASRQIFATKVSGQPGLVERLLDVVGNIPTPRETKNIDPVGRSRAVARMAAAKAASAAGALALPPGPLGWLTIAPELYAVWKIQAQMVADIAGAYGKRDLLTREQMLYCLFSHTAANAFRDVVIRVGERYVVRRAPLSALYAIGNKIAIRIAQRSAGRLVTRWVPAIGALGVAGYVYVDTGRVADASMDLFAADVRIDGELEVEGVEELAAMNEAEDKAARASRNARSGAGKSKRAETRAAEDASTGSGTSGKGPDGSRNNSNGKRANAGAGKAATKSTRKTTRKSTRKSTSRSAGNDSKSTSKASRNAGSGSKSGTAGARSRSTSPSRASKSD